MKKELTVASLAVAASAAAHIVPVPHPPVVVRVPDLRADEKAIAVTSSVETVEANAFFCRRVVKMSFTNPNGRPMQGELEYALPDGAFVCGYALEINGEMVPGVVCGKEKARVAFENEVRKGADPGLAEQVQGNFWRTRIFPLEPNRARRAELTFVAPADGAPADRALAVYERDGDGVFGAAASGGPEPTVSDRIAAFARGYVLWDASLSRLDGAASDRARLAQALPERGDWQVVLFADVPQAAVACRTRAEVLAAVDAAVYDGGTDLSAAVASVPSGAAVLAFTDEVDTLSEGPVDLEARGVLLGSRPDVAPQAVRVWRLADAERAALKEAPREATLLARVWAARRMADLASQAEARGEEFLALGRRYGVAGPGLSLIVLENLSQWLEHGIEPPATLACHAEWVRRRAAADDPIAARRAQADHEARLLQYWEERVRWWNDPKPRRETPSSGLFGGLTSLFRSNAAAPSARRGMARRSPSVPTVAMAASAPAAESDGLALEEAEASSARAPERAGAAGSGAAPTVALKAWNPQVPYLKALADAPKGGAYAAYLAQRAAYRASPAFYLDCAGWFFRAGEGTLARRVASNLAEFRLADAALWRSLGWRLREAAMQGDAASGDWAVRVFRRVLAMRGEEGQSYRDLALVLSERGKRTARAPDLSEAMRLLHAAAFRSHARRAARRGNDFQVAVVALEELNGLLAWCEANRARVGAVEAPGMDQAYRRDLPVKLRIVLGWDADETDIDLHVLEPNGEEAFYGNRRTAEGGFVSEDVTTGYGPEEYLKKELEPGTYRVLCNYFASHQTALTGATTVQATVYTDWATDREASSVLTLRLDKPRDRHVIGEVTL